MIKVGETLFDRKDLIGIQRTDTGFTLLLTGGHAVEVSLEDGQATWDEHYPEDLESTIEVSRETFRSLA